MSLSSVRTIETLVDFSATIVNRTLVARGLDGSRNPESMLVVEANMKVTGVLQGGQVDFDWNWDNGRFCRSGVIDFPGNPQAVELECQRVDLDENVVNFIGDGGAGGLSTSWFIE